MENLPEVADSEFVDMTGKSEVLIEAKDNKFEPQFVTVSPGTKVTFENKGRDPHNVIPVVDDQFPTVPTDEFQPGDTAVVAFDEAGLYPYYCSLHGTPVGGHGRPDPRRRDGRWTAGLSPRTALPRPGSRPGRTPPRGAGTAHLVGELVLVPGVEEVGVRRRSTRAPA